MMADELLKDAFSRRAECPPLESLAYDLDLPEGNRKRAVAEDHVQSCANCRTNLELARSFEAGMIRPEEEKAVAWITAHVTSPIEPTRPAASPRQSWWSRLTSTQFLAPALAAAAVLVVAVGISVQRQGSLGEPIGSDLRDDRVRAGGIALATPVGDLSRTPAEFCWSSLPGSAAYNVAVTEVDRTVVYQGRTEGICMPTPPSVQKALVPGKTLLWRVIAVDHSGNAVGRSETETFRIPISAERKKGNE
jgi:hypothetical protein